ncbi:transcriptional repressor p66-beta-like [Diretmus argenteus]
MERLNEEAVRLSLLKRGLDSSSSSWLKEEEGGGMASSGREELLSKRLKLEGHQAMERLKMLAFLKRKDLASFQQEVKGHHLLHRHGSAATATPGLGGGAYEERINGNFQGASVSGGMSHSLPMGRSVKENMRQEPVDMSAKRSDVDRQRRTTSPDVIILSDNETSSPRRVPDALDAFKGRSVEVRQGMMKVLEEELRLEETRLILLKKLRQSQIQKENLHKVSLVQKSSSVQTGSVHRGQTFNKMAARSENQNLRTTQGHAGVRGSNSTVTQMMTQRVMTPIPARLSPAQLSPVQLQVQRLVQKQAGLRLGPGSTSTSATYQQVAASQRSSSPSSSSSTTVYMNLAQMQASSVASSVDSSVASLVASSSPVAAMTDPTGSQAAAKLALRKQLEKTLLEIPAAKPPAASLLFLPSVTNSDFIYMIGLEEVVQSVLDSQGKLRLSQPFCCHQCFTDFTTHWRQEEGGRILCETCMTSNEKKALKAEHTHRLKNAFVKALQQEQEIEQRILSSQTPPSGSKTETLSQHHTHRQGPQVSPGRGGICSSAQGVLSSFASQLSGTGGVMATKHGGQAASSSHHRPQQHDSRRMRYSLPGVMNYLSPANMASPKSSIMADRQREYLLDMIPPRSLSHK